jgi:hypothetical protein
MWWYAGVGGVGGMVVGVVHGGDDGHVKGVRWTCFRSLSGSSPGLHKSVCVLGVSSLDTEIGCH